MVIKLRKHRLAAGFQSPTALAEKSGVDVSIISRLENGATSASYETLVRLAHALGIPVEELAPVDLRTRRRKGSRRARREPSPPTTEHGDRP